MITVSYSLCFTGCENDTGGLRSLRYCRDNSICQVTWHHICEPRFHMISWNTNYKYIYRIKYITNAPSNTALREHFSSVEKVDLNFLKLKRKISLKRR